MRLPCHFILTVKSDSKLVHLDVYLNVSHFYPIKNPVTVDNTYYSEYSYYSSGGYFIKMTKFYNEKSRVAITLY